MREHSEGNKSSTKDHSDNGAIKMVQAITSLRRVGETHSQGWGG